MFRMFCFAAIMALVLIPALALAQRVKGDSEITITTKKVVNFKEGDLLEGGRSGPREEVIQARTGQKQPSLIQERGNFYAEITKSADDI